MCKATDHRPVPSDGIVVHFRDVTKKLVEIGLRIVACFSAPFVLKNVLERLSNSFEAYYLFGRVALFNGNENLCRRWHKSKWLA